MIPVQLQNPEFRFALGRKNDKRPLEKDWNGSNNYEFDCPALLNDIKAGYNYIVCTGFGNLIVIDYDDALYFERTKLKNILPDTFEVMTANKRLIHQYYILKGDMFQVGLVDKDNKRMVDIQGEGRGVVGPGSCIDGRYYQVYRDIPIAEITRKELMAAFDYVIKDKSSAIKSCNKPVDDKVLESVAKTLISKGIKRTGPLKFECPFHPMHGGGNLTIMPSGNLYCFHEYKMWTMKRFLRDLEKKNGK